MSILNENEFDKKFIKTLRENGYAFPSNLDELKEFEKKFSILLNQKNDLPNLDNILNKGKVKFSGTFNEFEDNLIEENLARAARDGNTITDDVLEQMKKDRERAEKNNDNGEKKN